ncbi:histidine kinase N-terminal 7TM domain-containing protein [Natronolimnohabitans innermongolicus]|uniref:histidine kinase n=1 Tax=Natronolimnohabitans innermongolicus JCM 12255 TaxID=1227499 RepID=L9WYI9_9EURY|nr:histidine kinase N-terminal 7TM domain-containing protein [Natronolimnohabitans innermongolicus]ELY54482.1 putative signal-transducing histidine kinase [Natronolimnohabitans innermongolicus JCM 12255]
MLLVTVAIGTAAALLAWRERPEPGAVPLVALLAGQCLWSAFLVFDLQASTLDAKLFWANVRWIGVVAIPVAWVFFSLEYTGRDRYVQPRYVALLSIVPAITVALALADSSLLYTDSSLVSENGALYLTRDPGPWFWVIAAYTYLLGLLGALPLLELIWHDSRPFRGQSAALLVGILAPWTANALFLAGAIPVPGLDPTPVGFAISGVAYLGALTRFQLFGASPSPTPRARRLLFEQLPDGAIVIDAHDVIVDINESGAAILGTSRRSALGQPIRVVAPESVLVQTDDPTAEQRGVTGRHDDRLYDVTVTQITDVRDRTIGRVITFHDVSEHVRQQQRHEVLNRVFRHNIRTETNVISSYATLLADDDDRGAAAKITDSAARIELLATRAREITDVFDRAHEPADPVPLESLLEDALAPVREEYPDARIECDPVDDVHVDGVLEPVFTNLVENGIEHDPSPEADATVRIAVETADDGDRVRVHVTDDGPGIDGYEQTILERGAETPLEHSSGLGLWLAKWGTEIAGGAVSFDTDGRHGTTVIVEVPVLTPPRSTDD